MPHPWIDFVKQWALTHNMKYGCAMGDPKMREAYHSRNEPKSEPEPEPVVIAKKGRPVKHESAEAKYTAKLESNKQKRREKAEAKYSS
jgi:DUF4097 and DUF4098 domain-containing protein YvlB